MKPKMSDGIGRKIVGARWLRPDELEPLRWEGQPAEPMGAFCLERDDGSLRTPMRDEEGNGPGALEPSDEKGAGLVTPAREGRRRA